MRKDSVVYFAVIGCFAVSFASLQFALPATVNLFGVYESKLQIALFSGFLTIGGFLLSVKTFVLIKLREDLYDHPKYEERLETQVLANPHLTKYGPLKRLGDFLLLSVACSIGTALLQLTIGFLPYRTAAAICMAAAMTTILLVLFAWWQIKSNLQLWFELLEKDYKDMQAKRAADRARDPSNDQR